MSMRVLCLNAGSSSLKVALVDAGPSGEVRRVEAELPALGDLGVTDALRRALDGAGIREPDAIGHRLVHGGPRPGDSRTRAIDAATRARLALAIPFAPLHLPAELAIVDAAARAYPGAPQVAVFDTAFHDTLPDIARRLPIATWADEAGVRRYGFHGLSYEYVVSHLGADTLGPSVVAHLGSGASLCAVKDGRSVDTTMGMSPTGGVMMGTRTGDMDPGALVHLLDTKGWTARELEHFVNHECGLLGVSGGTSDMRALLERRAHDPRARLAVDLFVYGVQKAIAALVVATGGLRSLVFTGGIGARSAIVRAEICEGLAFLGVTLDAAANAAHAPVISGVGTQAPCTVRALVTDEEVVIARHVRRCLSASEHG